MNLNEIINIYADNENLIAVMKNITPLEGFSHKFYFLESCGNLQLKKAAINIFIINSVPEKLYDSAKYILCAENPAALSDKKLSLLYDLWPKPLTPSLIKFYFSRIQTRIKTEQQNTSEEREYQKRLEEMARQDYLTGLATRWYLQEYIKTNENEENITCIYFDLDNFKNINDTYGHQAGDRVLAATAEMMQREFTDGFAARMGGDEFMIVFSGERSIKDIESKVNIFMKNLSEYYHGMPTMKTLSVSAGISQKLRGDTKTIDRLIHESDLALYEAKKSGRDCCKIYNASMEHQNERRKYNVVQ